MRWLKLFLTVDLTLHAAVIAAMHITGRNAGILQPPTGRCSRPGLP